MRLDGRLRMIAALFGVLGAGLLLVACGNSPTPTTTSSSTTTAPATSSSSATTSTSPAVAACSTGLLSASVAPGGSAAGSAYETVTLVNNGPNACVVQGYATVAFYAPSAGGGAGAGSKLSVTIQDGGPTAGAVTLAPKSSAAFLILYSDVPAGGVGCVTVASATIALPASGETLSVPVSMTLCGGSVRIYPFSVPGSETP